MHVVRASYGLVQATVGVGTVLIRDFSVAITKGGGVVVSALFGTVSYFALCKYPPSSEQRQVWFPSKFEIFVVLSQTRGGGGGGVAFLEKGVDVLTVPASETLGGGTCWGVRRASRPRATCSERRWHVSARSVWVSV